MQLTNKQKQYLKSQAHSLKPVVLLGQNGLTEGVLAEIDIALNAHELIKVRIPTQDRELKAKIIAAIVKNTQAVNVQHVGHMLTLYRATDDKKIQLPRG